MGYYVEEYEDDEVDAIDDEDFDEDSMDFLLTYIASAQYLCATGIFYWEELQKRKGPSFPNLHTLVITQHDDFDDEDNFQKIHTTLGITSTHYATSIQRLHLYFNYSGGLIESPIIPHAYSVLTHISLRCTTIPLKFWYALRSALPLLQWGYFNLYIEDEDGTGTSGITECTLAHLTTFYLDCDLWSCDFSHLFAPALHLPALHTFSIYSPSYDDCLPIKELTDMLRFMPNLTRLSLGGELVSWHTSAEIISSPDNAPIWNRTPHLIDLQFELPFMDYHKVDYAEERLEDFIDNAFRANLGWLGLDDPACPIRTITVIDDQLDYIQDFAEEYKRDVMAYLPGSIEFRIAKKSMGRIASAKWKEWGARVRA